MKKFNIDNFKELIEYQMKLNGYSINFEDLQNIPEWYDVFTTTKEKEKEFIEYLKKYTSKKKIDINIPMFILGYGLKVVDFHFLKVSNNFKGWNKLINDMCEELYNYLEVNNIKGFEITYLKEKYGGLRVEYSGGDDNIFNIISKWEEYSYSICEECGEQGKERDLSRIRTLCDKHFEEQKKR